MTGYCQIQLNFSSGESFCKLSNRHLNALMCMFHFYVRKQLLLSARLSHRNSVCPPVCHMGGSVKNGAS